MNINKAVKKQNSSYKRFILCMFFVFIILPFLLFISKQFNVFFLMYLILIEILILVSIAARKNNNTLEYDIDKYRIKVYQGFPEKELNMLFKTVEIIHAEGENADMQLIIISKAKMRNRMAKIIDAVFLREYPNAGVYYGRLKRNNSDEKYYYSVIKTGGFKKFSLLNELYKASTNVFFTEEAILQIKLYRNSKV